MLGSWQEILERAIFLVPALLVTMPVHEAAHAGMAYLLGDPTAKRMGRLTLNPLRHIDPLGLLFIVLFRVGWAKPVIFNYRNFKRPRLYSVLTAYAGPASNFLFAFFVFVCWRFFPLGYFSFGVQQFIGQMFSAIAYVNVMLGVFNLLPIPPLDGSHLPMMLLVRRFPEFVFWVQRYSFFILIGFLVIFPQSLFFLINVIKWVYNLLGSLASW